MLRGRPFPFGPILEQADALVAAWLPGTEALGLADVLYGDSSPTGKLSFAWPRSMAQVPLGHGEAPGRRAALSALVRAHLLRLLRRGSAERIHA